jgi:hypothetical protein
LKDYGITLHPDKAKIGLTELEYVGHVITQKWMGMSDVKINKVLDFPLPRKGKQLKQFLGLTNYFRDHIQNFALLAYPLNQMILDYDNTRNQTIHWTVDTVQQFEALRVAVSACPKLFFMIDNAQTVLDTDASDYGIGAYLYQIIDNEQKPIAFLSKTLSKVQQRWSTIEKECYAIWYALRHWEFLLRDIFFTIRTDHRNLKYLNTNTPKVVRWKLAVQEYNFQLEDIKGPTNVIADALSRLCAEVEGEQIAPAITMHESEHLAAINSFRIPSSAFKRISSVHRTERGHFGVELTIAKLTAEFPDLDWPYLREHVKQFIKTCPVCQKLSAVKIIVQTTPFTTATYSPMERISIDSLGPLPTSNGYVYVLVIIDNFTRFIDLYPCHSTGAKEAASHIIQHCGRFGTPHQILSDAGTQFLNELMTELLKILGPEKIEGLPGSKQENSIVERSIKEVLRHLRAFMQVSNVLEDWVSYLPLVQRIMNATPHESIGVSPAQLLFGNAVHLDRSLLSNDGRVNNSSNSSNSTYQQWVDKMLATQSALINVAVQLQTNKDREHMRSISGIPTEFPINSYVLLKYPQSAMGHKPPTKLHSLWKGPYRVVNFVGPVYTLQSLVTLNNQDAHVSLLKQYEYDPAHTDPVKVALTDKQQFLVEAIRKHYGLPTDKKSNLRFEVKWEDYPESENTIVPWHELIHNEKLHDYLRANLNLIALLPKEHRTEEDQRIIAAHKIKKRGKKRKRDEEDD